MELPPRKHSISLPTWMETVAPPRMLAQPSRKVASLPTWMETVEAGQPGWKRLRELFSSTVERWHMTPMMWVRIPQ